MIRNLFVTLLVAAGIGYVAWQYTQTSPTTNEQAVGAHADEEIPKGPHGGKLFRQDDFSLELALFEAGVPPEFHVYTYQNDKPLSPDQVEVSVTLSRLDGQVDRFAFTPRQDYLRGDGIVVEPHSFDINIRARHQGRDYQWSLSSYEGRTTIPAEIAKQAGIVTAPAGPRTLIETLNLTGRVQTVPNRLAQVRARFPGVVQRINVNLGDTVKAGAVLARIQSNESLQSYELKAPIDGVVLARDIQPGANTGDAPLFLIADLTQVWVELDAFARDLERIQAGQAVTIKTLGEQTFPGRIDWVSPLATHSSQSVQARVILDNTDGKLRPGQYVRGQVTVAKHDVALAVPRSAIQAFRDFQVVFALIGDTYEVRMLELGRGDGDWVEITGGLKPGTEIAIENSYLIKADIEKSGASHDH